MSGGIESVTTLHLLKQKLRELPLKHNYDTIIPLFIAHGQRNASMEEKVSQEVCTTLGYELISFDINLLGNQLKDLQKSKYHIPIMHRNLLLISIATSFAAQQKDNNAKNIKYDHVGISIGIVLCIYCFSYYSFI